MSVNYDLEAVAIAISSPSIAPKMAPDQGLEVIPQVLPVHLPK